MWPPPNSNLILWFRSLIKQCHPVWELAETLNQSRMFFLCSQTERESLFKYNYLWFFVQNSVLTPNPCLIPSYIRDSSVAIIVYDITSMRFSIDIALLKNRFSKYNLIFPALEHKFQAFRTSLKNRKSERFRKFINHQLSGSWISTTFRFEIGRPSKILDDPELWWFRYFMSVVSGW